MMAKTVPVGIERYQRCREERSRSLVSHAIEALVADGRPVSFRAVAERSGVSRSTLYRNGAIREMVEDAREGACEQTGLAELQRQIEQVRAEVRALAAGRAHPHVAYERVMLSRPQERGRCGRPEMTHAGQ